MARDVEFPSEDADRLVALAIGGDQDAFATLFRLTVPTVHRYVTARCGDAALAEDLVQDAYIRALRAIVTSFEGGSSDFLSWVMRIARNRFLDHVKSGRMKWEVAVQEMPISTARSDPEAEALAGIEGADLRRALDRLTDDQQEIVLLRFLQGLHIAEVAQITGRTEGAVKALQFRALKALAKVLVDEGLAEDRR